MKTIFKFSLLSLSAVLILGACSRDNSVVSNNRIQKRKYTGGFHFEKNKKFKSIKDNKAEETVLAKGEETYKIVTPKAVETNEAILTETKTNTEAVSIAIAPEQSITKETIASTKKTSVFKAYRTAKKELKESQSTLAMQDTKASQTKISALKQLSKESKAKSSGYQIDSIVYILLCIFIPFVAVGLATDWEVKDVVINLILCLLCGIPGIIHAFIVCDRQGVL